MKQPIMLPSQNATFSISVEVSHVRESYRIAPAYEKLEKGAIPRTGRFSPASIALQSATSDFRWEVWKTMIAYCGGKSRFDFDKISFYKMPTELKEYVNRERKVPFTFSIDPRVILGRVT